ncbi:MAG: PAS domain-containing sensor histidine kinase [Desulfovibrionaceae bacterium]
MNDHSRMLAAIIESTDDAIISADTDLRIMSWNNAAARMYGYAAEEVLGRHMSILVPPERLHELEWLLRRLLHEGEHVERMETLRLRKDGTTLPVSLSYSILCDGSGTCMGFATIGRDISSRKRAECALLKAKAAAEASNLAKTHFLANISHEFRTPLNGILGLTQLLMDETRDTGHLYLDLIHKAGRELLGMVNGMIDLAGVELGTVRLRHEAFSPRVVLGGVFRRLGGVAVAKGLAFSVSLDASVPDTLIGDGARIAQIADNLISNAIRFTPMGAVNVDVRCIDREGVADALARDDLVGNMLLIEVRDTGVGVPKEKRESIFDCFTLGEDFMTKQSSGVGVGLAVSRTLAEMMGGGVWLESEEGKGSVFRFGTVVSTPRESCSLEPGVLPDVLPDVPKAAEPHTWEEPESGPSTPAGWS